MLKGKQLEKVKEIGGREGEKERDRDREIVMQSVERRRHGC